MTRQGGAREHAATRGTAVLKNNDVYGVSCPLTLIQFTIDAEMIQHPVMVEHPAPKVHLIGGAVLFAPAGIIALLAADDQHSPPALFQRTQRTGHNGVVKFPGRQIMDRKLSGLPVRIHYAAKGRVGDDHVHAGRRIVHGIMFGDGEALGAQARGPVSVQFVGRGILGGCLHQQHAVTGCGLEYLGIRVDTRQT